jgi:IMP dehydrogenase
MEFRLLPRLTSTENTLENISLRTPLVGSPDPGDGLFINIPIVSAAMQSVSGVQMGIELARRGGVAFIYCSQPIESQARMIARIKNYKAGFVEPKTAPPDMPIRDLHRLRMETGYSTFPVVDGTGVLLGLITRNDYDVGRHGDLLARDRMIPRERLEVGVDIGELKMANELLMESHQAVLPIVNGDDRLLALVFRKDIKEHLANPLEVVDRKKRLLAVAAINTHDYTERVPALVAADADLLAIDASDGYSFYQKQTLDWIAEHYPQIPVIGGNIITAEGFRYLVDAGARAVKVGMGSGSICITQEQKGTGRGLATSVIDVSEARDRYCSETGRYIPIIADGGIRNAKDIVIALALGADSVMMGRYFARMEESPTEKITISNRVMKPYWGEGSARARAWKAIRYRQAHFEEGVEGFVEYAGRLRDNLQETLAKIKSSMSSCGAATIRDLHELAELELVSALAIREGQVHDIFRPRQEIAYHATSWGH